LSALITGAEQRVELIEVALAVMLADELRNTPVPFVDSLSVFVWVRISIIDLFVCWFLEELVMVREVGEWRGRWRGSRKKTNKNNKNNKNKPS
jgi:hypothetical protein